MLKTVSLSGTITISLVKLIPGLPLTKPKMRQTNRMDSRDNLLYKLFYGHEIKREDRKGKNDIFLLISHNSVLPDIHLIYE